MAFENVVFYTSLVYNVVLNKLQVRTWYDRIDQSIILGALPFKGKFSRMLVEEESVRAVISMNQDFELKAFSPTFEEWKELGAEFLQLPTRDFVEAPSLEHLRLGVELIEKYSAPLDGQNGKGTMTTSVYIHCKAGRTRSATLVACYLVKRHNMTADEAVEFIRTKRPHIYLEDMHIETIREFRNSLAPLVKAIEEKPKEEN